MPFLESSANFPVILAFAGIQRLSIPQRDLPAKILDSGFRRNDGNKAVVSLTTQFDGSP